MTWIAYMFVLIPIIIGCVMWITSRQITWWEWFGAVILAILMAVVFNAIAVSGLTADTETWSGHVAKLYHEPEWVEEYEEPVYRTEYYTDSNGNSCSREVFDHYETRYRTHYPYWEAFVDYGKYYKGLADYPISESTYYSWMKLMGPEHKESANFGGFYSGDDHDYYVLNDNQAIVPANVTMAFVNKVKAAPSLFSFVKVPEGFKGLYEYPKNENTFSSDRLVGQAKRDFNLFEFDQLNSRLGPAKKVNLILVGFPTTTDMSIAQMQQAKWVGGKKNDLVICYAAEPGQKATWAYVFGWTEKELVKSNLATIFLENEVKPSILPLVEEEVKANYEIKDWKKFNYLTVDIPGSYFVVYFILFAIIQGLYWWFMFINGATKDGYESPGYGAED